MSESCDRIRCPARRRRRWGVGEVVRLRQGHGRVGYVEQLVIDDHGACEHDPMLIVQTLDGVVRDGYWPEEVRRVRKHS
jgi:hypothetical protein